jgi:serine/threonine protein kinase
MEDDRPDQAGGESSDAEAEDRTTVEDLRETRDPQRIGPYRVLEKIGEGGMGVVYLAEQEEPIRRRVVIKLIKLGMDTRHVIARFEAERQALALMSHQNVAKVFDAGATERGRPYFAMEYVPGIPITEYCDQHRLITRQRLDLFLDVCDAIQHAHQKGIIHRDIKPSNVLVSVEEGEPLAKVIDFGVAKATSQRLTERTLYTRQGVLVGTPEYMSPEQAGTSALDVDTRTDIYSLGVLLYDLLVGALPFEPLRLRKAALDELLRIIREEEPPKPSTRISSLGNAAKAIAARRGTDLPSLSRQVRGDLDWITMKTLEKDRQRRYQSAAELAEDLRRHLRDDPIVARPASLGYQVTKFARRNKVLVLSMTAVFLALASGAALSTWQAVRATRAQAQASQEAEVARQVSAFLSGIFRLSKDSRRALTAREILDVAALKIERQLVDQPLVRARVMEEMASAYSREGLAIDSRAQLEEALRIKIELLGEDHPAVADSYEQLGGRSLRQHALEIREKALGPNHPDLVEPLTTLGMMTRDPDEARPFFERAASIQERAFGSEHPGLVRPLIGLARTSHDTEEALAVYERALAIEERNLGSEHPDLAWRLRIVASNLEDRDPMAAIAFYDRARVIWQSLDHPDVVRCYEEMARLWAERGNREKALELLRAALDTGRMTYFHIARESPLRGDPEFEALVAESETRRSGMTRDLVKRGVAAWNEWREENPERRPTLAFLDGKGLDFAGANLGAVNLTRSFLHGANLRGADLQHATLEGAILDRADLSQANLYRANLTRASLVGTNVGGAFLTGAIGLTQEQLNLACGDLHTKVPLDLEAPPTCFYSEKLTIVAPPDDSENE